MINTCLKDSPTRWNKAGEAMFDSRTLAYFNNTLGGREDLLSKVFEASISISKPYYENDNYSWVEITNNSDVSFKMINGTEGVADAFTIAANAVTTLMIKKGSGNTFEWDVENMLTGYEEYLHVSIDF